MSALQCNPSFFVKNLFANFANKLGTRQLHAKAHAFNATESCLSDNIPFLAHCYKRHQILYFDKIEFFFSVNVLAKIVSSLTTKN